MAVSLWRRIMACLHYRISRGNLLAARLKRVEGSRMAAGAAASLGSAAKHLKRAETLDPERFARREGE